jgi:hypothetical protein
MEVFSEYFYHHGDSRGTSFGVLVYKIKKSVHKRITVFRKVILKIPYSYLLIELQSNPPKRPHSAANDVEGVEYRRLHHV